MKYHRLLALAFLCSMAACSGSPARDGGGGGGENDGGSGGGSGGGGPFDGGPLIPLSSVCAQLALKSCEHLQGCGQLSSAQAGECRAGFEARCAKAVRATDAGSWRYDPVATAACISATEAAPCYGGVEDVTDCLGAAFGAAGRLGAPCEGAECIEGYCPEGSNSCRACTGYFAQGQPCTSFNSCNPALGVCPFAPLDGGPRICEPLRGPGSECSFDLECAGRVSCVNFGPLDGGSTRCGPVGLGKDCALASDCGSSAYCKGLRIAADGTVSPGTCATRIALNAPCINEQYDDGCQGNGATCLGSKCITAAPHSRPLSAECDAYDQCPAGAYCTCAGPIADDGGISLRDGNCLSQQGDGGSCWTEEDYSMCLPGLDCVYPAQVCAPNRSEGQTCGLDAGTCLGLLTCTADLTPGVPHCVAGRKVGESCLDTLPCAVGLFCQVDAGQSRCASLQPQGGACDLDSSCQSGRCLQTGASKSCAAGCL
jgi:hypothetical protein